MPRKQRTFLLLLAALVVVAAIVIIPSLSDDDELNEDEPTAGQTATTTTPGATTTPAERPQATRPVVKKLEIVVRNGKPVGGVQRLSFKNGDTVKFTVRSDIAEEIHIHGYDLKKDVPAGGSVAFNFKAKADGIYEIELEKSAQQIAELRIRS